MEKKDITTIQPQFDNNTSVFDLCSGEDYIVENWSKTIKVTQREESKYGKLKEKKNGNKPLC